MASESWNTPSLSDPPGWGCICLLEGVCFSWDRGTGNLPSHVLRKAASFQRGHLFLIQRKAPHKLKAEKEDFLMDQMGDHRRKSQLGIIWKGICPREPPREEVRLQERTWDGWIIRYLQGCEWPTRRSISCAKGSTGRKFSVMNGTLSRSSVKAQLKRKNQLKYSPNSNHQY